MHRHTSVVSLLGCVFKALGGGALLALGLLLAGGLLGLFLAGSLRLLLFAGVGLRDSPGLALGARLRGIGSIRVFLRGRNLVAVSLRVNAGLVTAALARRSAAGLGFLLAATTTLANLGLTLALRLGGGRRRFALRGFLLLALLAGGDSLALLKLGLGLDNILGTAVILLNNLYNTFSNWMH